MKTNIDTRNVNLFVYDTLDNFENTKSLIGPRLFKRLEPITELGQFQNWLSQLEDDEIIFVAVHVFATQNIRGIKEFMTSGIIQNFPNVPYVCVTEKDGKETTIELIKNDLGYSKVCKYHELSSGLTSGDLVPVTKRQLLKSDRDDAESISAMSQHFKYAIITALYDDEFEELEKIFTFPEDEIIRVRKKIFKVGYLNSDKKIKVVAAFLNRTGPVEAGIISTLMLELFTPEFLLMSGVCGGAKKYNFGDIIIAKNVFAFQKGKLSDHKSLLDILEDDDDSPILFDKESSPIDYKHLYDSEGNQVIISIDNFEIEHDAMISLDTAIEDSIKQKLNEIKADINLQIKNDLRFQTQKMEINIVVEPLASGTMVINKKGFFEEILQKIDRKVAGVEMESYGVVRACEFANEKKTIPIIFKSVMDYTYKKEDAPQGINIKKFAAYTSALLMKNLFERKVI